MGCAVLCALVEIIIMAIIYLNPIPRKSDVSIKINNVEWHVFRRLDDEHFLCGDTADITKCTKFKVLEYDAMVQKNIKKMLRANNINVIDIMYCNGRLKYTFFFIPVFKEVAPKENINIVAFRKGMSIHFEEQIIMKRYG